MSKEIKEYIVMSDEKGYFRLIQYDHEKKEYNKFVDKVILGRFNKENIEEFRMSAIRYFIDKYSIESEKIYKGIEAISITV
jgi:glutaredoxin 2